MQKSLFRKCLFLLAALFLLIGLDHETVVQVKAANYKTLYKKFLQKKYKEKPQGTYIKKFYIINIDKIGAPELVYTDGSYGAAGNGTMYVYTIKNGKVKKAGEFSNRTGASVFKYNGKTRSIWGEVSSGTYLYLARCQYKNGKLKPMYICGYDGGGDSKPQYYVDDYAKKVNKAKYKSYFKKHFKSVKWKTYTMKELTLKNIKAI